MFGNLTGEMKKTTVQGREYTYYADFTMRGTYAIDPDTGDRKALSRMGYVSNDLRVRKEIARVFSLKSFRK